MTLAALGGSVDVPTPSGGKVRVTIPAGTQSGHRFRLRGKGIKSVRGGNIGDLMCSVQIETPVNLSSEQKNILLQFEEKLKNSNKKHSPKSSVIFS